MKPRVVISKVSKTFVGKSGRVEVLEDLSFSVHPHEVVSVVGPSGCGKTTLLRIIAGLIAPSTGTISTVPVDASPMIIFQQYERCLYPYLNVRDNVLLAILNHDISTTETERRINSALRLSALDGVSTFYPWELSGGMQQRVLLARCFAAQPSCLLLDEPFSSVDALTQYGLEDALRDLTSRLVAGAVYVTHDIDSAVYCADRVVVLSARPARIVAEVVVPFGDSRSQNIVRGSSEFGQIRSDIYGILSKNHA